MSLLSAFASPSGTGEPWVYEVHIRKLTKDGHVDTSFPRLTRECRMQLTQYGPGGTGSNDPVKAWKVTVAGFMSWLHDQLPGVLYRRATPVWRLQGVVPTARNVFVPRGLMMVSFDEPEDSTKHMWECVTIDAERFFRVYSEDAQFVCELTLVKLVCVWLSFYDLFECVQVDGIDV